METDQSCRLDRHFQIDSGRFGLGLLSPTEARRLHAYSGFQLAITLMSRSFFVQLSLAGNFSFGEDRVPEVLGAAREHAGLLLSLDEGAVFCLDLSFIDVTFGARRRFLETHKAYPNLKLIIRG
jgi:hypothetical protein